MRSLRFDDPWLLLLLLLIPPAIVWTRKQRRTMAVVYSSVLILRSMPRTFAQRMKSALPAFRWLAIALAIIALARPQHGTEDYRARTEGVAIEMCLDRSASMQALDFHLNGRAVDRLTAVKQVFRDFVSGAIGLPGRSADQIGLIAFGGFADALCPLTLDHHALLEILDSVQIPEPIVDSRGQVVNPSAYNEEIATAIGDAVALGVDRLKNIKAKSKVIILLSDGESNVGVLSPQEAAEIAKTHGIKIYSIGVGTTGLAPFPRQGIGRGQQMVRLDEETLRMLADTTGGKYFNAQDVTTLREIYKEIDQLEKTAIEGKILTQYRDLYPYLIVPAFLLASLEIILASTRFRSIP